METEKLQKVLAAQGFGSRRGMEQWIADGRVTVNGKKASLGDRVSTRDKVTVDGEAILRTEHQEGIKILQYNKPESEICSRDDPKGRASVFDSLPKLESGRWLSIGRLDINTTGLLLFTNNGELANKLMHPSTGLERRYLARVRGQLSQKELETIIGKGVELDGKQAKFTDVIVVERDNSATNHWVEVGIEEGRNREVRRIFEALGHPVSRLKRISYGGISLMPNIRLGHAKEMAPLQIEKMLKKLELSEFVAKVRPHKDAEGSSLRPKKKPRGQHVRGSKEAEAKSLSDRLSYKEKQERQKKFRSRQREERESGGRDSRKKSTHSKRSGSGASYAKSKNSSNESRRADSGKSGSRRSESRMSDSGRANSNRSSSSRSSSKPNQKRTPPNRKR